MLQVQNIHTYMNTINFSYIGKYSSPILRILGIGNIPFRSLDRSTNEWIPKMIGALEKGWHSFWKYDGTDSYFFWYVNMFKFLEQYKPTHFGLPSLIPGRPKHRVLAVPSLPSFPFLGPMGGDNFPLQRGKETKNFIPPPVYRLGWPPFPGIQWHNEGTFGIPY